MGLELFTRNLHPDVVAEIRGWANNSEMSKLLVRLKSIRNWQQFLDNYAEAMVARYFVSQQCRVRVEVPTISGKTADFEVLRGGNTFFVHVKRLNFDEKMQKDLNVGTRLASLRSEGIGFSFDKELTDDEMQQFHKETCRFSRKMKDGECRDITSQTGEVLGTCDKMKNGQSATVYAVKAVDDSRRYSKKLKEAYKQFIPDGLNVILITAVWRDSASIDDLREAVEDFWSGGKHCCSDIIGWFEFDPKGKSIDFELFFRKNSETPAYIAELFRRNSVGRVR